MGKLRGAELKIAKLIFGYGWVEFCPHKATPAKIRSIYDMCAFKPILSVEGGILQATAIF